MKRAIVLATVALLAMLLLAPVALAQDTTMMMGTTMMMEDTMMGGQMMGTTMMMEDTMVAGQGTTNIPESGGPAILLPAAALLLGSGILTYAILRRR